ncbi:peroxide stress protein YaaA [Limosilactobacillus sp.]|uniref:peroxide stress protein YaaA n=1 Tax=Limosilactobacillus sp. TaxID=2773925 RepID=UPI00345EF280
MQIVISPARTMNVDEDSFPYQDLPKYLAKTRKILDWMRGLSYDQLHQLWWNCSTRLADKNYRWLQEMNLREHLTPAIIAFTGLQYQHMAPDVFTDAGLQYIQQHLRILSGFYGLLRPFDGIVPYRLGMGDRAHVAGTKNLYQFWGRTLADDLFENDDLVLDLASAEYEKAILPYLNNNRHFVKCRFGEVVDGRIKQKTTQVKMARGTMVRYIAENQVIDLAGVKRFRVGGFHYCPELSSDEVLAFAREK